MTVLEVIQRSSEFLARKGVDSPRLQVELLLAHVLQVPRLKLYLSFDRVLGVAELDRLRVLVQRRGRREPLQHILGTVSFCGLELAVDGRVLIPRPETELLAEAGWRWLGALAVSEPLALDVGTGSGCLAIALAVRCPRAQVHALDISPGALSVARQNARRHAVDGRIRFHEGDGLAAVPAGLRFDLIVSNPPYIPSCELAMLQPEVREYDPVLALDGGPDGMAFYRRLAGEAPPFLAGAGRLMVEFGDGQSGVLEELFRAQKWVVEGVTPDYAGRPRHLTVRRA
ncbi:MAG: peptide chain release factor N(5)-glutamine methyltransferase [Verrucomicrobia bacterium]|nr:peptide chain release factor N(5)-glutamine methyltransferase [Verrucomicrobiota bacterium]